MPYECTVLGETPPRATDRLSSPTAAELLPSFLALLPRGRAWQTDEWEQPVGSTVMHRFWRGVAAAFGDFYRAANVLVLGSTIVTADQQTLADWEDDLGLPDPCVDPGATVAARRRLARLRLLPGGASPGFFTCLASRYGVTVTIKDKIRPFECGRSQCGGEDGCANDPDAWYVYCEVTAPDMYFEAGAGECGRTPLGQRAKRSDLECLFNKMKPAHTTVYFIYLDPQYLLLDTPPLLYGDEYLFLDQTSSSVDS